MALHHNDLSVGETRTVVLVDDLTRTQIVQYAGASGDFNPLHTDEVYATKVAGYPTVFAHGMLIMGMTARAVTDWVGADRLTKYGARFLRQVWPGDTLTTTLTVDAIRDEAGDRFVDLSLVTTNQDGADVLSAYAVARLDAS